VTALYTLTPTADERWAFDRVGDRPGGVAIADLLRDCIPEAQPECGDDGEITFTLPEHVAWRGRDLAPNLTCKLNDLCWGVVWACRSRCGGRTRIPPISYIRRHRRSSRRGRRGRPEGINAGRGPTMQMRCERRVQVEGGIIELEGGFFAVLEDEAASFLRRDVRGGSGIAHGCDGCGRRMPDVDLWAEDSETGEELWLCMACGES
jgi:hypothetical protein